MKNPEKKLSEFNKEDFEKYTELDIDTIRCNIKIAIKMLEDENIDKAIKRNLKCKLCDIVSSIQEVLENSKDIYELLEIGIKGNSQEVLKYWNCG